MQECQNPILHLQHYYWSSLAEPRGISCRTAIFRTSLWGKKALSRQGCLLMDIATEEFSHLEIVGATIQMLLKQRKVYGYKPFEIIARGNKPVNWIGWLSFFISAQLHLQPLKYGNTWTAHYKQDQPRRVLFLSVISITRVWYLVFPFASFP